MFVSTLVCFAQEDLKEREKQAAFDPAYTSYSRKKPAYVTLKTGEKIEADIKGVGRKKGQITEVKFIKPDGEKLKVESGEITSLYMAPSGLEKLDKQSNFLNDATKWGKSDASKYLDKGYTMYTNQMVSLKNKKKEGRKWESSWVFSIYNLYARRNAFSISFEEDPDNIGTTQATRLSILGSVFPSATYNFKF